MAKRIDYKTAMRTAIDARAEEAAESPAVEAGEQASGGENSEASTVAGPRAVGKAIEPIPHAGSVTSKPGSKGGHQDGHPQNKLVPVKVKRTAASPVRPTSKRRSAGPYLHTLSKV